MHDARLIRENPALFDAGLTRRNLEPMAESLLRQDDDRRKIQTALQEAQAKRNDLSRQVGDVKRTGGDASALMAEVAALKDRMAELEAADLAAASALETLLATIPNTPAADVPTGKDEHDNVELRKFGTPSRVNDAPEHFEIGEALGMMDFTNAAKLSGARFTVLSSALAQLERALGNFMLDIHTREFGYTEVSPPLLVRDEIMFGTAQLPKFEDDQFRTTTGLWMIPTAEVPLTNLVAGEILEKEQLPLRFVARTPCFRAEAGSAGRDTRGMLRQHQFYKVELVSITAPEESEAEHERMTSAAETVLKRLEIPFRTIVLCTGDMGFASKKTYDIEAWLPGQKTYREISSCSNCGDFQARRMKARFRAKGDKQTALVHTLNGSGVAIGRCLIAVLENYRNADGSVTVPTALQPYMNGLTRIEKVG
jgi:seryl-tRNA synthetase